MDSGVSLYYPYIEIRDEHWLKSALLYWDAVRRIVPIEHTPKDSPELSIAIAAGLLRDTEPKGAIGASNKFWSFVSALSDAGAFKLPDSMQRRIQYNAHMRRHHRTEGIYLSKMAFGNEAEAAARLTRLTKERFIYVDGDVVHVTPPAAAFFMTMLAQRTAEILGCTVATDDATFEAMQRALATVPFEQGDGDVPDANAITALLRLEIDYPSPDTLRQVPMAKIVRFAQRHRDEIVAFRSKIDGHLRSVAAITDADGFRDASETFRREIKSELSNYRAATNLSGFDCVKSALNVSIPTVIEKTLLPHIQNANVDHLLVGAGMALGLAFIAQDATKKAKDARLNAPYSYLLKARTVSRKARWAALDFRLRPPRGST